MQASVTSHRPSALAGRVRFRLATGDAFWHLVILAILAFELLPIGWVILTSVKPEREFFAYPPSILFQPTLANFGSVLTQAAFLKALLNTVIVSVVTTMLAVLLGVLMSYALARFRFRGADLILIAVIATRMVPRATMLVPFFVMMRALQLTNTLPALVLAYSSFALPFAVWMMYGFFLEFPSELEDAARVDGCSRLQALWHISLPLVAPGVAATAILTYIYAWNEFVLALILAGGQARTLPVYIATFVTERETVWGDLFASSSIAILPVFVLAMLVQKHLVRGLTAGAVKG